MPLANGRKIIDPVEFYVRRGLITPQQHDAAFRFRRAFDSRIASNVPIVRTDQEGRSGVVPRDLPKAAPMRDLIGPIFAMTEPQASVLQLVVWWEIYPRAAAAIAGLPEQSGRALFTDALVALARFYRIGAGPS